MLNPISTQISIGKVALVAGLLGLVVLGTFGLGVGLGSNLERVKWQKRAISTAETCTQITNKKEGETQQCRAQVAEFARVTAELEQKRSAELLEDRAAREQAAREQSSRDKDARQKAQLVLTALQGIRDDINNGKFDPCTNTVADSNFIGLLNDALSANRSGIPGRDGPVSDSGTGD